MARQMMTTPEGTAFWAKVFEPEEDRFDEGKPRSWSISWCGPADDTATVQLMQTVEEEFARIHGEGARASKNAWPFREQQDREGVTTGLIEFRFRKNETTKRGITLLPPAIYDARKNPWPAGTLIGNGSRVKVAFSVWGWEDKFNKKGVSLSFEALQVIDLVPYERLDASQLFQDEDGYVADKTADAFGTDDSALPPSQRLQRRAAQTAAKAAELDEEVPF